MSENRWRPGEATQPTDHVIAVVQDQPKAEAAVRALRDAGFAADNIVALHGQADYEQLQAMTDAQSPLRRFTFHFLSGGEDTRTSREGYWDALREGRSVVLVYAPTKDERERAESTLKSSGGYHIMYLGRWTVEPANG